MNRKIKFRGKRVNGGEWVESMTISMGTIKRKMYKVFFEVQPDKWVGVISDTVGQFTGKTDKNGKEIYEYDILKHGRDGRLYVVKFFDGMFYASVEECNKNIYGGFPLHVLTDEEDEYKCEVVGNIFDNKQLLKSE